MIRPRQPGRPSAFDEDALMADALDQQLGGSVGLPTTPPDVTSPPPLVDPATQAPPVVSTGPNRPMATGADDDDLGRPAGIRPPTGPATTPPPTDRARAIAAYRGPASIGQSDEQVLRGGYQHFLGREADPEGLAANLRNPGGLEGALGVLYDSPEGLAFRNRPTTTPDPTPPPGTADTTTGAGRRGWASQSGTGLNLDRPAQRGDYGTLEGFNLDRAFAGGDPNSVKDAFARWVTGLGFNPARASKDEIEQVLRANIDNAAQYGINILDVSGENILVETAERGPEWVDVVRGAGAGPNDPDAAWQWGAADDSGGGGDALAGGGGGAGGTTRPGGIDLEALGGNISDPETIARILAEIQRLIDPAMFEELLGGALSGQMRG